MRPNIDSFSRVSKEELYGFVCPDCMVSLESPDALLQHFESTHNGTKKLADTSESQPPGTVPSNRTTMGIPHGAVPTVIDTDHPDGQQRQRRDLLEEMSELNNTLIQRIASDGNRTSELECILELLLEGTPLPSAFKFSDQLMKTRVERFLEKQLIGATTESALEDSNAQLKEKEEEIAFLQSQLVSKTTKDFSGQTDAGLSEDVAIQTAQSDLDQDFLQTELQRLRNENSSLNEEVSLCRTQCSELERKLEACCVTPTECVASVAPTDDNHVIDAGIKNAEVEELLSQVQLLEQRLGQSESLRNSERSASIAELDAINSSMLESKLRAEEAERTTSELRASLEKKSDEITQQALEIATLQKDLVQLRHTHQTTVDQLSQSCTAVQTLEFQMAELKLKHESEIETQMAKMQDLSHSLSSMQTERDLLRTQCDELACQITQHLATIESAEAKLTESRQQLELELEQTRSQLSVSKKEADSLMERLIKSEDQVTTLRDELGRQVNEVECLNKAIFELGRENQSLQIMRERVTSRQWTKDNDAPACASCNREFSISNRRHHCRNCGGVFCHPCSSNRASTAASKDPVRVCNHCYSELTR
ncbi:early endosome antigen 1 [Clonorchis sinensis]|uniref:Early endosome antigen 1 n=1 Tax=Clonorchis sinensis TaxID=79923 RepID=A0A8T1M7U1_CLOSI|nr:early endosome antigen 1 [Clonorchis sinensis]